MSVCRLLVSGTEKQLFDFRRQMEILINPVDRRADTILFTCFDEDFDAAMESAKSTGVTVEKIIGGGEDERYEMLHQGVHPGWEKRDRQ